ncbi:hypothetical protein BASA81_000233 [Batrachochytrium salamandrivorans]|nr:hypothetical protein BASA81_000233 [Batrachochytrium salamandrivorans]
MFQSPTRAQVEGLSAQGQFLAMVSSKLGGNEWCGELRVFSSPEHKFDTVGAVKLESSAGTVEMFQASSVACGGDDGVVRLYNISNESGLLLGHEFRHDDVVASLACVGSSLVSGSWDKTVQVHDGVVGTTLVAWQGEDLITVVRAVSDNLVAVGEMGGSVSFWDLRTAQRISRHKPANTRVCSLANGGRGGSLLVGGGDGGIRELVVGSGESEVVRRHRAAVHSLAVWGDRLLSGSDDGAVKLDDTNSNAVEFKDFCRGVAFWNQRPVASSWDGTVRLAD